MSKNRATPKNWNSRYLTAGKGIWLYTVLDSKPAISAFKTAGLNHSAILVLSIVISIGALRDICRDKRRKA